ILVPLEAAVAPVPVPVGRAVGVAEEFDLHLLEFPRAEGEIPRRDLIAKTLADLGDAKRYTHPAAVHDVLEVDEDSLRRLRTQERRIGLAPQGPQRRLEHQVEFAGR